MYAGEAAELLADKYNVERVENSYFFTQKRYDEMRRVQLDILVSFYHIFILNHMYFFFFLIFTQQKVKLAVPEEAKEDESTGTVGCAALGILSIYLSPLTPPILSLSFFFHSFAIL